MKMGYNRPILNRFPETILVEVMGSETTGFRGAISLVSRRINHGRNMVDMDMVRDT